MNKKYVPKDAVAVSAAQWVHDDPDKVAEFLKMLIDHDFRFCFDGMYEGSEVSIDIHGPRDSSGLTFVRAVDHWNWLVIHSSDKLEEMSDSTFRTKYREA